MADSPTGAESVAGSGKTAPRVQMRRVIAGYKPRAPLVLGVLQIVFGALILIFGVTNVTIKAFVSVGGTSFLAAIALFACGVIGIVSSKNKEIWAISMFMLLAIIALIFNVTLMAAAGVGVMKESGRTSSVGPNVRAAIDLVLCVLAIMVSTTLVWTVILCSMTLFYGCCRQHSGARYVPEPQVKFTPEDGVPGEVSIPSPGDVNPAILPVT